MVTVDFQTLVTFVNKQLMKINLEVTDIETQVIFVNENFSMTIIVMNFWGVRGSRCLVCV